MPKSFELKKSVSSEGSNYLSQIIKVTSGKKYVYSGYVKTIDVGTKEQGAGIWFYYYISSKGQKWLKPTLLKGTNNWKKMTINVEIPSDVNEIHAIIGIYSDGTLYADNLTLYELGN